MTWIIIDTSFGADSAHVVTNEDGENEQFETKEEADQFIEDELQGGVSLEVK